MSLPMCLMTSRQLYGVNVPGPAMRPSDGVRLTFEFTFVWKILSLTSFMTVMKLGEEAQAERESKHTLPSVLA